MKIYQVSDYIYMSHPKNLSIFMFSTHHQILHGLFILLKNIPLSHFIYKALALRKTLTICYFVKFLPLQFCKAFGLVFSFLNLSTVPKNILYFLLFLAQCCCFEVVHKAGKKKNVFKMVKGVMIVIWCWC